MTTTRPTVTAEPPTEQMWRVAQLRAFVAQRIADPQGAARQLLDAAPLASAGPPSGGRHGAKYQGSHHA